MRRKFDTKKFIEAVLKDEYALVIGNEILLDTKLEPTGDVHQYLLRKVNERGKEQFEHYNDIALYREEPINPVRNLVEDGEIKFTADAVSPELMSLLETKLFTTILTTTTDGFLEAAMRKVWGEQLRVVNIYDKDSVDDLQRVRQACRKGRKYNQPTLIYVFGKMDEENPHKKYIRTENDAILLIEKWMRMNVESSNELLDFIRSKRLLALGCKYDNWYFRFFWYVLTGNIDSKEYDGKGEVAFVLNTTELSENKLQQFLERNYICILGETRAFIRNITKTLTDDTEDAPLRQRIMEKRHRGDADRNGIFISYSSKDALAASKLFFQLIEENEKNRNKNYDVWLDQSRLYGGDNYEKEIEHAINAAKVFIAILSPHVAEDMMRDDFLSDKNKPFYKREWNIAKQLNDKTIIPLAINGYDLHADYHKKFEGEDTEDEANARQTLSGIDLMDAGGFYKLISAIDKNL